MCYSAQLEVDFKNLRKKKKARVDLKAFEKLYKSRLEGADHKIPKALDANFQSPESADEKRIEQLIAEFNHERSRKLEGELFKQKKRLADAERMLKEKVTKAATESQRIATTKIDWHLKKIADIKRTELKDRDSRIFPFHYAPVFLFEDGEYVIRPMRYHCRPAGKPETYDHRYDGLYNARRDNLEGFWKGQFGQTHAFVVMTGFYENVAKHDFEHRELRLGEKPENLVIHFNPRPKFEMNVACLWSHWEEKGRAGLDSFAAITDEPPTEVAATGHNRCIIPLTDESLDRWMNPQGKTKSELNGLLDGREKPFYEHRLAA